MKVIAFNGSPRADGNTSILIQHVLEVLQREGDIETEFIQLGGQLIQGCTACGTCMKLQNRECKTTTDEINVYIKKMIEADGIILGSPTYFSMMTPELKALIDRAGYVSRSNGHLFRHKIGAAIVAVRRTGAMTTFDAINHFFLINEMIIPGSSYWNIGIGTKKHDIEKDQEGIETMETLGKNIAWLLKKINT